MSLYLKLRRFPVFGLDAASPWAKKPPNCPKWHFLPYNFPSAHTICLKLFQNVKTIAMNIKLSLLTPENSGSRPWGFLGLKTPPSGAFSDVCPKGSYACLHSVFMTLNSNSHVLYLKLHRSTVAWGRKSDFKKKFTCSWLLCIMLKTRLI